MWSHDPIMEGWRRALKGWGKELEWKSNTVVDAWLECEGDTWVRWSQVKAVNVRPKINSADYQIVFVMEMNERFAYATKQDKETARQAVVALLQQLSHDFRQSA